MIRVFALAIAAWATLGSLNPDAAGIERLRQRDIAATLTQNPDQLVTLWDDDVTPHFESLVIEGPVAYEWGRFEATFRGAHDSAASVLQGRFLRVMKKERDGSWRYTRIMWQEDRRDAAVRP